MSKQLITRTSEAVGRGHPDKIADQVADAILDAYLKEDKEAKVACEIMVLKNLLIIAGQITANVEVNLEIVARETLKKIGYNHLNLGLDYRTCAIKSYIDKQSLDIAEGVAKGAGDQGIMYGFATVETKELMPLTFSLAQKIMLKLDQLRQLEEFSFLKPDGKCQISIAYNEQFRPLHIDNIVLSQQHDESIDLDALQAVLREIINKELPSNLVDEKSKFYINSTGRFVIGGPLADTGLTGRKIMVDSYGTIAHHGGGAFSGKDPTKVDRSGAYAARYVAKNIVAAGLASRIEVQLGFVIGVNELIALNIETFSTETIPKPKILEAIRNNFDLTPFGIIKMLDLKRPIYELTAFGGHFGRELPEFTWEKTDKVERLKNWKL